MTERSRFWDGQILGDCGPYNQTHLCDQFFRSVLNGTGNRGVLKGWLNELEVTGTTTSVDVASGGAVIYGALYENTATVSVSISTPSSGLSRIDRIVVQRVWSTQLARIAKISGTAAISPTAPALTQTPEVTYEIPLAQILVDSGGLFTITDEREWCTFSSQWPLNSVEGTDFEDGAVTADKIPDRTRYFIKEADQLGADSTNPPTWTVGASYDYWSFADAATNIAWLHDATAFDHSGAALDVYLWSVPDVNGAGGGVEAVRWDYGYSVLAANDVISLSTGTITPDQQARVNTTAYRDLLISIPASEVGRYVVLSVSRLGGDAADSYASAMRLLGVEFVYTAQA